METKLPPPAPEDGPICGVTHTVGPHDEFGFYTCTASRGHVGDHVAYGPDPGNEVHHTWPARAPGIDLGDDPDGDAS